MQYGEAVKQHGSIRKAAASMGLAYSTFHHRLKKENSLPYSLKVKSELPPDGFEIKGVSTLYDAEGNVKQEWVKTSALFDRQKEALVAAASELQKDLNREKPTPKPKHTKDDLASCYVLTDYHLGQLSWGEETGEDWDTEKAEKLLIDWFGAAISAAPASSVGILCQLGDFLHFDGHDPVTPTSGHVLDVDTRFQNVVRIAISAIRQIIHLMLKKHEHVHVIMAEGNHDLASSVWLRELFAAFYENEPRVTVDNNPTPFYCFEWGRTSLFFHHGHKKKIAQISKTFAGMYRQVFGRTKYSYAHMGHFHHKELKEDQLMEVEQHQTLTAKDAYSARGGYISHRSASVITYSKKAGEVSRSTIRPEMFE